MARRRNYIDWFYFEGRPVRATVLRKQPWIAIEDIGAILGFKPPKFYKEWLEKSLPIEGGMEHLTLIALEEVWYVMQERPQGKTDLAKRLWGWINEYVTGLLTPDLGPPKGLFEAVSAGVPWVREPEEPELPCLPPLPPPCLSPDPQGSTIPVAAPPLSIFDYSGRQVRTIDKEGEIWFVANDVCTALAIANPRDALASLDDDEKGVGNTDTLGGTQVSNLINESGLYNLIFRSRKEEAKAFRRWVTHEVLPAIRKSGSYGQPDTLAQTSESIRSDVAKLRTLVASLEERLPEITTLSTRSAGKKLGLSWKELEVLIDSGELSVTWFEGRRRIPLDSLAEYQARQEAAPVYPVKLKFT